MKHKRRYTTLEWLWMLFPVFIWLNYYPLIKLGQDSTMYFELSLTIVYLAVVSLVGLPLIWRARKNILRSKIVQSTTVFVLVSCISLLWTQNLIRGVLSSGVLITLFLLLLSAIAQGKKFFKIVPMIVKVYILSALVVGVLAVVQMVFGIWSNSSSTLLCAGCVADQFGFARPNVFMIEPQFLGNALLPAVLILAHQIISGRKENKAKLWIAFSFICMVVVLTLSRGAILALLAGMTVLFVVNRSYVKNILLTCGAMLVSLALALLVQGVVATLNPNINMTFSQAIRSSVNQLSMGVINILPTQSGGNTGQATTKKEPNYDGYVEESTDARTKRTSLAIGVWSSSVPTMIFGTGVGSAGVAMHSKYPDKIGEREIVQNEYVEILLEKGLIGLTAFLALLGGLIYVARSSKWLWSIITAFMVQWLFFSGYPNALHIYIVLILVCVWGLQNNLNISTGMNSR